MIDVPIQIYSDSSAARSVARRRGIGGRLRHLQTRHLWLQSRVALGHLKLQASGIQQTRSRSHYQVASLANGQNVVVKDGCSNHDDSNSKLEKYRMVENEPSWRTRNARGRGSGQRVECSNGTESRKESGNVEERDDVMQLQ